MTSETRRRRLAEGAFTGLCLLAVLLPLAALAYLIGDVAMAGAQRLDWSFLTNPPSRKPELAGIMPALYGSLYLVGLVAAIAVPVGVAAAAYLEEYAARSRWTDILETNIANLAGVPSVIYGLLGLGVFVRALGMERSLLAGACTLSLLVLPVIIITSREALRTVPDTMREACLALGSTRWQMLRRAVLPMALPGIMTGAILALARAVGETAPLIVVGALTYVTFAPEGLDSPFTALPIQIYNWVSRPQAGFQVDAAAGICVLLIALCSVNAVAVAIRARYRRSE